MKKNRIALIVLMVFAFVFISLNTPATVDSAPKYGGKLVRINAFKPGGTVVGVPWLLAPGLQEYYYPTIDLLLDQDGNGAYKPRLATSWDISTDKTSITFHLRDDVKFHDGTDFNADAAKWNMDKMKENKQPGTALWASIEAVDKLTLRLNLTTYSNTVLSNLATPANNSGFISPHSYETKGEEWAKTHSVGTGPFIMTSFDRDVGVTYVKNDNYWLEGRPYLDEYEIIFITNSVSSTLALRKGEAQCLNMFRGTDLKLKADLIQEGYAAEPSGAPGAGVYCMVPDSRNPDSPLANQLVRKAIEYGIDKEAIRSISYGLWKPTYQIVAGVNAAYVPELRDYRPYDTEKAKELLAQAGYADGLEFDLLSGPGEQMLMEAIQAMMLKIGVKVNIEIADRAKMNEYTLKGWNNALLITAVAGNPNIVNSVDKYFHPETGNYYSVERSDAFNAALAKAMPAEPAIEYEEWKANTQELVKEMAEECMVIPLFEHDPDFFIDESVLHDSKFKAGQQGWADLANAWMSQ